MTRNEIIDKIIQEYQNLIRKHYSPLTMDQQLQKKQHLQDIKSNLLKDEIDLKFSQLWCPSFINMNQDNIKHELRCIVEDICGKHGIKATDLEKIK